MRGPSSAGFTRPLTWRSFDGLKLACLPFSVASAEASVRKRCGDMVAAYPEDWRETLKLYRYCVLERRGA